MKLRKLTTTSGLIFTLSSPAPLFAATDYVFFCQSCNPGTYSDGTLEGSCADCNLGTCSLAGASSCMNCKEGTSTSSNGTNLNGTKGTPCTSSDGKCVPCSPGYYADVKGLATCKECPEGKVSAAGGATGCTGCGKGKYAPNKHMSQCNDVGTGYCATGSANTGRSGCTSSTNSGSYPGVAVCNKETCGAISCNGGYILSGTSCSKCGKGTFTSGGTATQCTSCNDGYCQPNAGQTSCTTPCTSTSVKSCSKTTCAPTGCNPGYGGSNCSVCNSGKYSKNGSLSGCDTCSAGQYSGDSGAKTECTSCSAGTYSGAGASSCTSCSAGTYSGAGASSCTDCGEWTWSSAGSSSCTSVRDKYDVIEDLSDGKYSSGSLEAGYYVFIVGGGKGGNVGSRSGGSGGQLTYEIHLKSATTYKIGAGSDGKGGSIAAGGGGGSWVSLGDGTTFVAGGGGGAGDVIDGGNGGSIGGGYAASSSCKEGEGSDGGRSGNYAGGISPDVKKETHYHGAWGTISSGSRTYTECWVEGAKDPEGNVSNSYGGKGGVVTADCPGVVRTYRTPTCTGEGAYRTCDIPCSGYYEATSIPSSCIKLSNAGCNCSYASGCSGHSEIFYFNAQDGSTSHSSNTTISGHSGCSKCAKILKYHI